MTIKEGCTTIAEAVVEIEKATNKSVAKVELTVNNNTRVITDVHIDFFDHQVERPYQSRGG